MPDLVTHATVVLLPAAVLPRRWLALTSPLALGAALPDLVSTVPYTVVQWGYGHGFLEHPRWFLPWVVLHTPLAVVLASLGLSLAFRAEDRRAVGTALVVGVTTHLSLDLLQNHHGTGYYLLYPFSLWQGELAWMGTEATVRLAPALLGATVAAWTLRGLWLWRSGRQPAS